MRKLKNKVDFIPESNLLIVLIGIGMIVSVNCLSIAESLPPLSNTAYYLQIYNSVNLYRAKHIAPALKWNRTLNEEAESLAQKLARYPDSVDDPEDFEGVNYYETIGPRPPANLVIGTWYNESNSFNFNFPQYTEGCLNFTQMIWKSSTTLGVGTATWNNISIVVTKFIPRGNIKGRFRLNVIPVRKPQ